MLCFWAYCKLRVHFNSSSWETVWLSAIVVYLFFPCNFWTEIHTHTHIHTPKKKKKRFWVLWSLTVLCLKYPAQKEKKIHLSWELRGKSKYVWPLLTLWLTGCKALRARRSTLVNKWHDDNCGVTTTAPAWSELHFQLPSDFRQITSVNDLNKQFQGFGAKVFFWSWYLCFIYYIHSYT